MTKPIMQRMARKPKFATALRCVDTAPDIENSFVD
jgi:hypothetical protein